MNERIIQQFETEPTEIKPSAEISFTTSHTLPLDFEDLTGVKRTVDITFSVAHRVDQRTTSSVVQPIKNNSFIVRKDDSDLPTVIVLSDQDFTNLVATINNNPDYKEYISKFEQVSRQLYQDMMQRVAHFCDDIGGYHPEVKLHISMHKFKNGIRVSAENQESSVWIEFLPGAYSDIAIQELDTRYNQSERDKEERMLDLFEVNYSDLNGLHFVGLDREALRNGTKKIIVFVSDKYRDPTVDELRVYLRLVKAHRVLNHAGVDYNASTTQGNPITISQDSAVINEHKQGKLTESMGNLQKIIEQQLSDIEKTYSERGDLPNSDQSLKFSVGIEGEVSKLLVTVENISGVLVDPIATSLPEVINN